MANIRWSAATQGETVAMIMHRKYDGLQSRPIGWGGFKSPAHDCCFGGVYIDDANLIGRVTRPHILYHVLVPLLARASSVSILPYPRLCAESMLIICFITTFFSVIL